MNILSPPFDNHKEICMISMWSFCMNYLRRRRELCTYLFLLPLPSLGRHQSSSSTLTHRHAARISILRSKSRGTPVSWIHSQATMGLPGSNLKIYQIFSTSISLPPILGAAGHAEPPYLVLKIDKCPDARTGRNGRTYYTKSASHRKCRASGDAECRSLQVR